VISNSPPLALTNLTVTANVARAQLAPKTLGSTGTAQGGGLFEGANGTILSLTNATLNANSADAAGSTGMGGNLYSSVTTNVKNTIVSAGTGAAGSENCAQNGGSQGHNLDSRDQCGFHAAGDRINTNPLLGSLTDNGGPVQTQALIAASPAVNNGDNSGCPSTDARGVTRPQGSACDIGAFELAPPSATSTAATGVGTTFATLHGSASNPDVVAGTTFFQWGTTTTYGSQTSAQVLAAGALGHPFTAAVSNLAPGATYHFRAVAISPEGTSFGSDKTFTATLQPSTKTKPRKRPPTLTLVSLTNKRFRVAKRPTAIFARKAPLGTTFRFTLSAPAKLTIAITRTAPGLRGGHGCLAPTAKLKHEHAKRCTRTLTVGTLTRSSEPKGADRVPFSGRIGRRALRPRAYNAVLSASNAAGRSKPVTLSFIIVR
jgi:hypothetical protein